MSTLTEIERLGVLLTQANKDYAEAVTRIATLQESIDELKLQPLEKAKREYKQAANKYEKIFNETYPNEVRYTQMQIPPIFPKNFWSA
tara:strand:+ start:591 stop:854 length:264 start_codon:yes stop_codon:yes gene_type:complete